MTTHVHISRNKMSYHYLWIIEQETIFALGPFSSPDAAANHALSHLTGPLVITTDQDTD
jgi:hypothetical protein